MGESTYTIINTGCPICSGQLWPEEERVPDSLGYHEVGVVCEECSGRFTIEYRPIDISWLNPAHEPHSAVSQGLLKRVS